MRWTSRDDETVEECRKAMRRCKHYHVQPAAWFSLCVEMYQALEEAGLIQRAVEWPER